MSQKYQQLGVIPNLRRLINYGLNTVQSNPEQLAGSTPALDKINFKENRDERTI